MANETNTVTLMLNTYNQIKAENQRLNLFLDHLLATAKGESDKVIFDSDQVELAVKFCFPERWKKALKPAEKGGEE